MGEKPSVQEQKHVRELYELAEQCKQCKFRRPKTPTKDCNIHRKLVVEDSPVAWKHRHLFLYNGGNVCKMFKAADE